MISIKPFVENRPWGNFVEFTRNTPCTVKIIEVESGQSLSRQTHHLREEFWYVIDGIGKALIGEQEYPLNAGLYYSIPKETEHRIEATEKLRVLEIATGQALEDDIVRLEDNYGRANK